MNLEEDFLDDVLELGARADHSKHETRYLGAVSKEELSKSLAIPSLAARDHFVWFEHSIEANPRPRIHARAKRRRSRRPPLVLVRAGGRPFKTVALTQHRRFLWFFSAGARGADVGKATLAASRSRSQRGSSAQLGGSMG